MKKTPWDSIRWNPPSTVNPLKRGSWWTTGMNAGVNLIKIEPDRVILQIGGLEHPAVQVFGASDLRELSAFCLELADQLERPNAD